MKKVRIPRHYIFGAAVVGVFSIVAVGIVSEAGYVRSGFSLVQGGTLEIIDARGASEVFIDNRRVARVGNNGSATIDGISLGEHTVIVSHEQSWPWSHTFTARADHTTTLRPLQMFQNPKSTTLAPDDDSYTRVQELFNSYQEPTKDAPLTRNDSHVWVADTRVFARTAGIDTRIIYQSPHPIRTIAWLGERDDTVIIANQHSVFALDIRDSGDTQNFHPVYTGATPSALIDPQRTDRLFVADGDQYIELML